MSVFKVALNNVDQGVLDLDPSSASSGNVVGQGLGNQMQPSIQRGVYIMGPNLINRLLLDGETFTDCNYWKRFAYPNVPLNEAFIEVIDDDGSIFSDIPGENTFPVATTLTVVASSVFTDNEFDIITNHGGAAIFTQISNTSATEAVTIRLNGSTDATFTLGAGLTQVFNAGDLSVTLIQVAQPDSGASDVDVQIIVSVSTVCTS